MATEKVKGLEDQKDIPTDLAGFEDVGVSVDHFWTTEGKLLCRPLERRDVMVNGQETSYYVVALLASAHCRKGKKDDPKAEVGMQPKGTVIGVWAKAQLILDGLKNCVVLIERGDKIKLDANRTMWKFKIQAKGNRGEQLPIVSREPKGDEGGKDSDIPF